MSKSLLEELRRPLTSLLSNLQSLSWVHIFFQAIIKGSSLLLALVGSEISGLGVDNEDYSLSLSVICECVMGGWVTKVNLYSLVFNIFYQTNCGSLSKTKRTHFYHGNM